VQPLGSSLHFMEPEGSLPSSEELHIPLLRSFTQKIRPGPRLIDPFRNEFVFYGKELLAQRPTPKLEEHPLSFVRDCLFNLVTANLKLEAVPTIRNPRTRQPEVILFYLTTLLMLNSSFCYFIYCSCL
jgi:hypothetical protein